MTFSVWRGPGAIHKAPNEKKTGLRVGWEVGGISHEDPRGDIWTNPH